MKQILSIGVSGETNRYLQECLAMDQVHLKLCRDIDEAIVILSKDSFRLFILDASAQDVEQAQENVAKYNGPPVKTTKRKNIVNHSVSGHRIDFAADGRA